MSVRIYFSNGSVRNTTLSCDSLGVHYTVSKTGRVVSLARWDSQTNSNITVGEIEFLFFEKSRIRVGQDGEWQLAKDFLSKREGNIVSRARSFIANNGVHYTWKIRWERLVLTHMSEAATEEVLAIYRRNLMIKEPLYLEIFDTSIMDGLDSIILTFLVMEKRRRDG